MEMTNLKPCPFCGGEAKFFRKASFEFGTRRGWQFGIHCTKCGVGTPKNDYTVEIDFSDYGEVKVVKDERPAAIEKWNLRTHH
jgi:Lar family restriction alleviation protein